MGNGRPEGTPVGDSLLAPKFTALVGYSSAAGASPFVEGSTVFGSCASASFQAATACSSAGLATLKRAIARSSERATSTSWSARPRRCRRAAWSCVGARALSRLPRSATRRAAPFRGSLGTARSRRAVRLRTIRTMGWLGFFCSALRGRERRRIADYCSPDGHSPRTSRARRRRGGTAPPACTIVQLLPFWSSGDRTLAQPTIACGSA